MSFKVKVLLLYESRTECRNKLSRIGRRLTPHIYKMIWRWQCVVAPSLQVPLCSKDYQDVTVS